MPVKPLQSIAMGMIVVLLLVVAGGYDLLANPLGWVLIVLGIRALPEDLELRPVLLWVAVLAGVVSVPLWVPAVIDALDDADESLAWAVNLPQFGCYLLICLVLSRQALAAGEKQATVWWRSMAFLLGVVVALPVLIFGGGLTDLEGLAGVLVGFVPTVMIVMLFVYSGRSWAGAPAHPENQDNRPPGSPGERPS